MGTGWEQAWEQALRFGKKRRWGLLPRRRMTACSQGFVPIRFRWGGKNPPSPIPRLGAKVARLDATVQKKICTILMPLMAKKKARRLRKGDAWTVLQLNIEIAVDHERGIFGLTPG